MRSPVAELLVDLAAAFRQAAVDWYLFGAQAAILHGASRLTADVDVTVRLPETTSTEELAAALEQHRFRRRFSDPAFTERTRVMPFLHPPTALPLDIVLAGPGIEDVFFARAQEREVEGTVVRLASAEDLVVMKILAGRPKDVDDVGAIVMAYGDRLDVAYIERTLTLLEHALVQSDLRPLFQQIVQGRRSPS
jgi:hypothetical protein